MLCVDTILISWRYPLSTSFVLSLDNRSSTDQLFLAPLSVHLFLCPLSFTLSYLFAIVLLLSLSLSTFFC